ncbi:DUF6716 putative glycosyltransferase [Demequina lignilytica]|uniref:CDP-Glycerol:Poly(Glycerophosphate) glycerophosphotransferase n=1 Tax=Demequina lignilytica TaxID=3051663 RepID=A0AB35MKU1_9MICO|nr:DUF6716 putative glycosyltransferase [Demequina sp. SYSU T0a273]MDN4484320.1 hypothetical protein [Demequina sp. SYSU T0a273]
MIVVADSDSYLKWAAGMFPRHDESFSTSLYLVRGSTTPSDAQIDAALRTTDWSRGDLHLIEPGELLEPVAGADVLVVAVRGAMALVIGQSVIARLERRPVIVTGLPGMSIPAKRRGLVYRSYADLFVLHSKTEVEQFEEIGADTPLAGRFALATLPFTSPDVTVAHDPEGAYVFATQALVPATLAARRRLAQGLLDYAAAHPRRDLIIKIRNAEGERQTHADNRPLQRLVRELCDGVLPSNMRIEGGALVDVLDGAAGLITISSTAALEALEYGQPVALIDDFGVSKANLNRVFEDSGLLTPLGSLDPDPARWNGLDPAWLEHNYFHPEAANDWRERLDTLVEEREAGPLAEPTFLADVEFSAHELLYWSATALDEHQWTVAQRRAVVQERRRRAFKRALGAPQRTARRVLRGLRWRVRRVRGRGDAAAEGRGAA